MYRGLTTFMSNALVRELLDLAGLQARAVGVQLFA